MQSRTCTWTAAFAVVIGMAAGCKEPPPAITGTETVSAPVSIPAIKQAPDAPVVSVNGETLTRAELDRELDMITTSPQFATLPPEQAVMIRQQMESRVVDRYISQKLLTAAASTEKVDVTDDEISEYIDNIRETLPEGVTLESIMEERQIPMAKLREDIGADIRIRKLLEAKTDAVPTASDEQIAAYYESNKELFSMPESVQARHILVRIDLPGDEDGKSAARTKIEAIHARLVGGEAVFEAEAREHSDCPSGQQGGDLGSFARGQMVPAFEEAAFTQDINVIGPVVETQFGYHIIQVIEKQQAGEQALADVKADIAEQLTMQEKQNAVHKYLETLQAAAHIQYGE